MRLFTEIEENLNKTPDEILMIAILYVEKKEGNREDAAESARAIRRQEILAQKEELVRRQTSAKIAEGEKLLAEKEEKLVTATEGLTMKETVRVLKTLEEKAAEEFKKFNKWGSTNIKFNEEIKKFEDEKKHLAAELLDINNKEKNPRLQPKEKKKLAERGNDIKIKLPIVIRALEEKVKQHNIFLLENELLIRTNVNFKDQALKDKLIEKIEQYKKFIQSRQSIDDAPEGMTADEATEWASLKKYLKYKQKYLELKNKVF